MHRPPCQSPAYGSYARLWQDSQSAETLHFAVSLRLPWSRRRRKGEERTSRLQCLLRCHGNTRKERHWITQSLTLNSNMLIILQYLLCSYRDTWKKEHLITQKLSPN